MAACLLKRSTPRSLAARIRAAEQQVSYHRRGVGFRATALVRKIHQQMTSPGSLLLAGSIGFMIGELTTRTPPLRGTAEHPGVDPTTPIKTVLNLLTSVRALYTALPIAWMIKTSYQPDVARKARKSHKARKRRSRRSSAAFHAANEGQGDH